MAQERSKMKSHIKTASGKSFIGQKKGKIFDFLTFRRQNALRVI